MLAEPSNESALPYAPVERIAPPSVAEFRARFEEPSRPVVLAGLAADWPARERWSPAYLAERFGDARVRAFSLPGGRIRVDRERGFELRELSLREYAATVNTDNPEWYLRAELTGALAALGDDLATPSYFAGRRGVRKNLWFGASGTISSLHFDLPHNLYVQIAGRKRFILFAPSESKRLYAHGLASSTPHLARADPELRGDPRFPLLARARGCAALLEAGDALFIPARFWHHARALSVSIAVNFWSPTGLTRPLLALSDLYKRVRGLNI